MTNTALSFLVFLATMACPSQALGFINPFAPSMLARVAKIQRPPKTQLGMGWFDFNPVHGGGSGKEALDEQWEAQQEILRARRNGGVTKDSLHKKYEHGGPATFNVKAREIQVKEARHRAFQDHTFVEDNNSSPMHHAAAPAAAKKKKSVAVKKTNAPKFKLPW